MRNGIGGECEPGHRDELDVPGPPLTGQIVPDCRVFGFATGTLGYALRLSEPHRAEADRLGAKVRVELRGRDAFDLSLAGPEWRFGKWFDQETAWCRAAYDRAAEE